MTTPKALVDAALRLAAEDEENKVPEYHPTNTGEALCRRTGLATHFKGDGKHLRSIYTACRWLIKIQPRRYNPE